MRIAIKLTAALVAVAAWAQVTPTITPATANQNAYIGVPFTLTFGCTGCGTISSWALNTGNVPGLTFSPNGVLSGTPTTAGFYGINLGPKNPVGNFYATRDYLIIVDNQLVITTPANLGPYTATAPINFTVQSNVGTITGVSGLPTGLTATVGTGGTIVSGSVATPGTYNFTATAFYSSQAGTQQVTKQFSLVVVPVPVVSGNFPQAEVGVPYSGGLSAVQGITPYTFSIGQLGALPAGTQLNAATGAVTGTPTTAGTANFQGRVTDAQGVTTSSPFAINVAPAFAITTTGLSFGITGQFYSATITTTGGVGPPVFSYTSGPGFLSLNSATGVLSGTPNAAGIFTVTVTAQDALGAVRSASFPLTIYPAPVIAANLPQGEVGVPYAGSLNGSQGRPPFRYSASNLPPGLALDQNTGAITGTPTAAGAYTVRASVMDQNETTATQSFILNIAPQVSIATVDLPDGQVNTGYSSGLAAAGGVPPYTWAITSGALPAGLTLSSTGAISGTPTSQAPSFFTVQVTDSLGATASRSFSIGISSAIVILTSSLPNGVTGVAYSAPPISASGGSSPYAFSVSQGSLPAGLTLSTAGLITGTPTAAGTSNFVITATDLNQRSASRAFSITISSTLTITTTSIPAAVVGSPYTVTFSAAGGTQPYSWSSGGTLPPGFTFSGGTLSGAPQAPGSSSFSVSVTDARGANDTRNFTLVVNPALSITTNSLARGAVGTAYADAVSASGGTPPYTFSAASLPPGLSLTPDGNITGTPTTAGTSNVNFTVSDGVRTASKTLAIIIGAPLQFPPATLPVGQRNNVYSATLGATGGVTPYSFSLAGGSLPPGLSLAADGSITGTPTTIGSSNFTARVTDAAKQSATQSFTIRVVDAPVINTASLPDGTVGVDYSASLDGSGNAPLAWSVSGTLPPGLSFSGSTISGKPTTAGTYPITVSLSDANQQTVSKALSIRIGLPNLPPVTITTTASGTQTNFGVTLGQTFPVDLTGTATLSFQPDSGPGDPDIVFANGTRTVNFRIPAGQSAGSGSATDPLAFQTGTTSGRITITVVLNAGGQPLNPNPAATRVITIDRAAPVITSVTINRSASGFDVVITGYSNTREITGSTFQFTGSNLTNASVPVTVGPVFQSWYAGTASSPFGTQFKLTVPFSFSQGGISSLTSVQVTLTNSVGSSSRSANF